MKSFLLLALLFTLNLAGAQSSTSAELSIENEVNAVQGPPEPATKNARSVEEELRLQEKTLRRKKEHEVSSDRNVDRFPEDNPMFRKPQGPPQGGSVRVEHPRAADGLIRINKDGSYQYRTQLKDKSQSGSFQVGMMTPPKIKTDNDAITYETMYGDKNIYSLNFDYQWQPFHKYGALGLRLGAGLATVTAKGFFKTPRSNGDDRSEESYNLFIVPLSAFVEYRFEYMRRQWVVPFINGGATMYGMAEVRNDGKAPKFAGAPAAGGGGGLLLSISRLDSANAFTLSQEYGIADMWLVLEARAMQGLSSDTDFSNQTLSAGISVDF